MLAQIVTLHTHIYTLARTDLLTHPHRTPKWGQNRSPKQSRRDRHFSSQLSLTAHGTLALNTATVDTNQYRNFALQYAGQLIGYRYETA